MKSGVVKQNKYIGIVEVPRPMKGSATHLIFNKKEENILGWIEYYQPWKQHVFVAANDKVVWNNECLQLVIDFLNELKKK